MVIQQDTFLLILLVPGKQRLSYSLVFWYLPVERFSKSALCRFYSCPWMGYVTSDIVLPGFLRRFNAIWALVCLWLCRSSRLHICRHGYGLHLKSDSTSSFLTTQEVQVAINTFTGAFVHAPPAPLGSMMWSGVALPCAPYWHLLAAHPRDRKTGGRRRLSGGDTHNRRLRRWHGAGRVRPRFFIWAVDPPGSSLLLRLRLLRLPRSHALRFGLLHSVGTLPCAQRKGSRSTCSGAAAARLVACEARNAAATSRRSLAEKAAR